MNQRCGYYVEGPDESPRPVTCGEMAVWWTDDDRATGQAATTYLCDAHCRRFMLDTGHEAQVDALADTERP